MDTDPYAGGSDHNRHRNKYDYQPDLSPAHGLTPLQTHQDAHQLRRKILLILPIPAVPAAPVIDSIAQPTCTVATGTIYLSGLPATGTWTLTRYPGGITRVREQRRLLQDLQQEHTISL